MHLHVYSSGIQLDSVSVDTFAADALACAEIYNCQELKNRCIDFLMAEKNFKKAVLTDSFMCLGQKFHLFLLS